jgi:hypothetical protein
MLKNVMVSLFCNLGQFMVLFDTFLCLSYCEAHKLKIKEYTIYYNTYAYPYAYLIFNTTCLGLYGYHWVYQATKYFEEK